MPFCSRTDAQCCSVEFLDRLENVVLERLGMDLREEYKNVIIAYHEEIEELIDCESKNIHINYTCLFVVCSICCWVESVSNLYFIEAHLPRFCINYHLILLAHLAKSSPHLAKSSAHSRYV